MKKPIALAVAAGMAVTGASFALAGGQDGGTPESVYTIPWDAHDKPSCPAGSGSAWSQKIDPVVSGTYGPVTITVDGSTFSWVLNDDAYDMGAVMVKGGPSQVRVYVYDYADPVSYDDAGSGLTAAINPHNGKPYGLSHIYVCLDPKNGGDD